MREIKKYVRFYIQKRIAWKDTQRPRNVVMMFNYDAKRLCTLTGLKVAECDWDATKQRVKLNVKRANQVNAYLDGIEQKVNDIYYGALANSIRPDNNFILKELKKDRKVEKPMMLDEWQKYLHVRSNNLKPSSIEALRHSFEHFKKFARGKRVEWDDITAELLSEYAGYLRGLGHVDNTIHKHIKRMRAFMTYAKKAGLHNNDRYRDFNVSEKAGRIVFLEWSEVKTLLDYQPENSEERKTISNFIWGCVTSMRYSDYHALKKSEIVKVNFEGLPGVYHAAKFRQIKTDKMSVVPLLPEALAILKQNELSQDDYALPRISNQVLNRVIKDICKKAGINSKVSVDVYKGDKRETSYYEKWQLISTHIGRKTFISVAASKSIPVHIVASIAGHSVKTCMKYYAGVADKDRFVRVVEEMCFDE